MNEVCPRNPARHSVPLIQSHNLRPPLSTQIVRLSAPNSILKMHATLYLLPALVLSFSVAVPLANGTTYFSLYTPPDLDLIITERSHADKVTGFPNIRDRAARALAAETKADADDAVSNTWDRRSLPVTPVKDADDTVSNTWDRRYIAPRDN
jgi:hypothetical protein